MADTDKKPNPVDVHVGRRVRLRRNMLNLSQEKLGDQLGVTFQQVQKYEKGTNRIGASRLQQISAILDTNVSFFFEGLHPERGEGFSDSGGEDYVANFMATSEGLQLVRAFSKITDPKVRKKIVDLVKSLSEEEE